MIPITFYIVITILILYYSELYTKFPDPIPLFFDGLGVMLPDLCPVSDDIEGIYESEDKLHGFHTHFMITMDSDSDSLVSIKYRGSKNTTDDPKKLLEKEINTMKENALDVSYEYKSPVEKIDGKYKIFDTNVEKDGTMLIFKKKDKDVIYHKIRDI